MKSANCEAPHLLSRLSGPSAQCSPHSYIQIGLSSKSAPTWKLLICTNQMVTVFTEEMIGLNSYVGTQPIGVALIPYSAAKVSRGL